MSCIDRTVRQKASILSGCLDILVLRLHAQATKRSPMPATNRAEQP